MDVGAQLLDVSRSSAEISTTARLRQRRRCRDQIQDVDKRAAKASMMVIEGSGRCWSGTWHTCHVRGSEGNARRPERPRDPIPRALMELVPRDFQLDEARFAKNLRSSKRGAACGNSSMTTGHLRPLLDSPRDTHLLFDVCQTLATAKVPQEVKDAMRLGRMTTLSKDDGGVRGVVAGDVIRRLTARTMAQQLGKAVESSTAPFQFALSTKAGCGRGRKRGGGARGVRRRGEGERGEGRGGGQAFLSSFGWGRDQAAPPNRRQEKKQPHPKVEKEDNPTKQEKEKQQHHPWNEEIKEHPTKQEREKQQLHPQKEETKLHHPTEDRGKSSPTQRRRRKAAPPNRWWKTASPSKKEGRKRRPSSSTTQKEKTKDTKIKEKEKKNLKRKRRKRKENEKEKEKKKGKKEKNKQKQKKRKTERKRTNIKEKKKNLKSSRICHFG